MRILPSTVVLRGGWSGGGAGDAAGDDARELLGAEGPDVGERLDRGAEGDEAEVPDDGVDGDAEGGEFGFEQVTHDAEPFLLRLAPQRRRAVDAEEGHDPEHLAEAGAQRADDAAELVVEGEVHRDAAQLGEELPAVEKLAERGVEQALLVAEGAEEGALGDAGGLGELATGDVASALAQQGQ